MKSTTQTKFLLVCLVPVFALVASGHQISSSPIPPSSCVFIDQMDGFGPELQKALIDEGVPLVIVSDKRNADFEIMGSIQDANEPTSKKPMSWSQRGGDRPGEAPAPRPRFVTVKIVNVKTGDLAWGYGGNGMTDLRSTAEACAKQLKRELKHRR